jgi:LPS sulfotransferase NodH
MPANGTEIIPLAHDQKRPLLDFSKLTLEWRRLRTHASLLKKWWLRRHVPYQPLFLIATCRSGSNLLMSYLAQQPGLAMLSEVLSPQIPIGPRHECIPPVRAIAHIRRCLQGEKTPVRGCKLMLYQLANCRLTLDDLRAVFPTAKYIILYRQSLAEQFVSHQLALATGQYQLPASEQPKHSEIVINAAELRRYCDEIRRGYCELLKHSWLADRAVLLSYEELTANAASCLQERICPLLGVQYMLPQTRLRKQNTQPLADRVANYRDVSALLHSPLCRQYHHLPAQPPALPRAA